MTIGGATDGTTGDADDGGVSDTAPLTTTITTTAASTTSTTATPMSTTSPMTTTEGETTGNAAADESSSTGGGEDTSGGGEDSTGSSFETSNDGELEIQLVQQTAWETGECNDVIVTNVSAASITWVIDLDIGGALNQSWNAVVEDEVDGVVTFSGAPFNAALAPGAAAMFGYCVDF